MRDDDLSDRIAADQPIIGLNGLFEAEIGFVEHGRQRAREIHAQQRGKRRG